MKKKFLSLMMAAAVVATTSVSAFAEVVRDNVTYPDSANVTTQDDTAETSNVTITGNVADDKGNMPTASFKVTVPTAASFTVNKNGDFIGADLEIKNEGSQKIDVYAQSFHRISGENGDINLVKEQEIKAPSSGKTRADVALKLEAQGNKAYLGPTNGGTGVYNDVSLESGREAGEEGVKLLTLSAGDKNAQSGKILLRGLAGKGKVGKAISNDFQLTLRIKKVMNEEQQVVSGGEHGVSGEQHGMREEQQ